MNNLQRQQSYNLASNRAIDIGNRDRQYLHYPISDVYARKFKYMNGGNAPIDYLKGINPNHKFKHINYDSFIDIKNDLNQPILNRHIWEQLGYLANERSKVPRISKRAAYNMVSLPNQDIGSGNTIGDARFGGAFYNPPVIYAPPRLMKKGRGNTIGDARFGGALKSSGSLKFRPSWLPEYNMPIASPALPSYDMPSPSYEYEGKPYMPSPSLEYYGKPPTLNMELFRKLYGK